MAINTYDVGALVQVNAAFTDQNNNPIDPTTVFLNYNVMGGAVTRWVVTTGQVVRASQGNYYAYIDTTSQPGIWNYRWYATGTGQSAQDNQFEVKDSVVK